MAFVKVRFTASGTVKSFLERGVHYQDGAVIEMPGFRAENLCKTYPAMFTTDIDSHPEAAEGSASDEKEDGSEQSEPSPKKKKKTMAPKRNRAMKARHRK